MTSARSRNQVVENIEFAYLDDELFELLHDSKSIATFRNAIITHWFPDKSDRFERFYQTELPEFNYELDLRGLVDSKNLKLEPNNYDETSRSRAFRNIIIEAYDYRCAATGWRIITPDDKVLVEAAHIIPFHRTRDDDPRNGMALTPTYHWALDHHLIAPGADFKWHVTKGLDSRIRDYEDLLSLEGKEILLPKNKKYWPKKESLEWAVGHLLA